MDHSVIRLPYHFNSAKLDDVLGYLRLAEHNADIGYRERPWVFSCVTAVRFLISTLCDIDHPEFHIRHLPDLPQILLERHSVHVIPAKDAKVGDLVFYFGNLITGTMNVMNCVNHIGMIIDEQGTFYHSTRTCNGYTLGNLSAKIKEGKIATTEQLLRATQFTKTHL